MKKERSPLLLHRCDEVRATGRTKGGADQHTLIPLSRHSLDRSVSVLNGLWHLVPLRPIHTTCRYRSCPLFGAALLMASGLERLRQEELRLITNGLSPCSIALLMSASASMKSRLLNGGVSRLYFDSLEEGRVVTFGGSTGDCASGNCSCLLSLLHQFTQVEELVINNKQLEKSFGAKQAPYPGGLPKSLKSLTVVLRMSFLRWISQAYRNDYLLSESTPRLIHLRIAEVNSLPDRAQVPIVIDRTLGASGLSALMSSLPQSLESLLLPMASHQVTENLLPPRLTRTSLILRWKASFESITLPKHLVSLNLKINDATVLDKHGKSMLPATLTDLTVHLRWGSTAKPDDVVPQWIKHLPPLSSLSLCNINNVKCVDFPPVLTHFTYVAYWPCPANIDFSGWVPEYLTYLKIRRWEPVNDLHRLPKSIERLSLHTDKPTTISRMPESLTKFTVPSNVTFLNPHWPSRLHTLRIRPLTIVTSDTLVTLPKILTSLAFTIPTNIARPDEYFHELPTSIKHITLWNRKLDAAVFKSLKDSQLVSLHVFGGDTKSDMLSVEIQRFKWSHLEYLPHSLTQLRLPVSQEKFEPVAMPNLVDLSIPNTTVAFEALQLSIVLIPNMRRLLAKEYKIEKQEIENANKVLSSQPMLTLRSIMNDTPAPATK